MDPLEPDATDGAEPPPPGGRTAGRTVIGLPPRTLAICVCVALIGALVAALVASALLVDDANGAADTAQLDTPGPPDLDTLLAVELTTTDDRPTTLAAHLDGRPMVLNIWAQSCAPCVEEMPMLEAAHQANPDVAFFGVDTQDRLDRALEMADQTGITYPWVQDSAGNFFYEARAAGMPTTLFLDRRGRILATKTGPFTDQAELQSWIDTNRPS